MTHRHLDPPAADETIGSPGGRLREARAIARLGLDEVATRLRLDRRVVEAIERDDYTSLPQPTFVRGYLRSYARLLDLPSGPIVEAYDRLGFTPPGLVPDISSRPETRSTDMPVRLVTYALVASLVLLGVAWWRSEKAPPPTPLDLAGAEPGTEQTHAAPPAPEPPAPVAREAGPGAQSPGVAPSAPATPPAPLPTTQGPTPTPGAPPPTRTGAETVGRPSTTPAPPPVPPAAGPAAAAAPGPVTAGVPPPGAGDGARGLILRLKHDSWVEVYDGGGKRLFFNLAKAGQTLSLTGTPPLRVILGYARDAEVEYNGQPFDATPHTNRDIARFTVGG
jgi:cytoskeleton protein RodZ